MTTELEDSKSESKISAKKFGNELQEIKHERERLLEKITEYSDRNRSLENDVKQLREANNRHFHASVNSNPESAKKEKIILESLSIRNQELEVPRKALAFHYLFTFSQAPLNRSDCKNHPNGQASQRNKRDYID